MKKIGILTHYNVHNYGAELQLFALKKVLASMGFDASALRYKKNYDFINPSIEAKYNISIKSIPIYIKYLFNKGFGRTVYNFKKKMVLKQFRDRNHVIGEYYSQATDLYAIIVGSDEIFSIEAGPNPWYWGIGAKCDNIISYAASFGPTDMEFIKEHRCTELMKAALTRMRYISVRDLHSKRMVKQLADVDADLVCDPVFLYGFQQEMANMAGDHSKYVVVYSYDDNLNNEGAIKSIRNYAKRNNLRVISVGYYHGWCEKNIACDPLEVFHYFLDAKMVFTDTFHGSVLSILCNTPLVVTVHGNGNKLRFLLQQYGLQDRIVESFSKIDDVIESEIDYKRIQGVLEKNREASLMYLKESLLKE